MKQYQTPDSHRPGYPPCCYPPQCRGQGCCYPTPVPFVAGKTYYAGQVVIFENEFYVVNENNPKGTPGCSPDFTRIPMGPICPEPASCCCPTGPTGPTGPRGAAGPTGPTEAVSVRHRRSEI